MVNPATHSRSLTGVESPGMSHTEPIDEPLDATTISPTEGAPDNVPAGVARVTAALVALGAQGTPIKLPELAATAATAAAQLGCEVGAIANSLIFKADGEPLLVMTSGAHRADVLSLATLLEVNEVSRADADFVRTHTSQPIGGVSPVGHPEPLQTVVDIALSRYPTVWAAAGHPQWVFPTHYDELLRITAGQPAEVGA